VPVKIDRAPSDPDRQAAGPDGALWFTLNQANAIGRITVDGDVALYPLPTPGAAPVGITSDGDAMWFAEIAAGQIGKISTDGGIEEFPLPDRTAKPHAIVAASAGDCWFTEWGASRIGRITTTGEIAEYDLPSPSSEPHGITVGPDAALWVALETGGAVRVKLNETSGDLVRLWCHLGLEVCGGLVDPDSGGQRRG
jgi:virginiamycin B lyase